MKKVILSFLVMLAFQSCAQQYKTENIILITLDGYRWQEMFKGIDSLILESDFTGGKDALRAKFWLNSQEDRVQV